MESGEQFKGLRRRALQSDLRGLPPAELGARLRQETGCTSRQACEVSKASKGALHRAEKAMMNGRCPSVTGRPTTLSDKKELVLVDLISERCQNGEPPTSDELCEMVRAISIPFRDSQSNQLSCDVQAELLTLETVRSDAQMTPQINDDTVLYRSPFGNSWFRSFMRRHTEELQFKKPRTLEPERHNVRVEDLEEFYSSLDEIIEEKRIHPALLANMDETMLKALNKVKKVVFRSQCALPTVPMEEKVTHITLAPCVFANGDSLLPLCILNRAFIPTELPDSVKVGFHWAQQRSGWMTSEIFHWWITEVFIPHVEKTRLVMGLQGRYALLLVDGHSSRANPAMLTECLEAKILVKTLVAHSSSWTQTLDRGVFRAFKVSLTTRKGNKSYKNGVEWRTEMLRHTLLAMREATSPGTVLEAWKESGCWPVDSTKAINLSNFPGLELEPRSISPPRKRARNGFRISNRLMTSEAVIAELSKD